MLERRDIQTILLMVFLDALGFTIAIPIMPRLVQQFTGDITIVPFAMGILLSSYSVAQFLAAPSIGALSDRIGRRPVILAILLISIVDYLISATANSLWLLLFARIMAGAIGGNITIAFAYVADVTLPQERAKAFGLLTALFSIGFIAGPLIGGYVAQAGIRAPFLLSALLTAVNFAYAFIALPGNPPAQGRSDEPLRYHNPFLVFRNAGNAALNRLLAAFFLLQASRGLIQATFIIFVVMLFDWNQVHIGAALTVFGVCVAIAQGALVGPLAARIGEPRTIRLGLALTAFGFVLFAFARQDWQVWLAIVVWSFGMMAEPAIQSLSSRQVPETEQGTIQGVLTSMNSLGWIFGPLIGGTAFSFFTAAGRPSSLMGGSYLVGAVLIALALAAVSRFGSLHRVPQT